MVNPSFYSKQTIDHFRHPRNYGEIKNSDGKGEAGNIICGDVMSLYIKIKKNKKDEEVISNIKFKTYGCAAAIATSSVITELVKGKTIKEALQIDKNTVVKTLHGLPPIKIHCSLLAVDALNEAIYQYLIKNKKPIPKNLEEKHERIERSKKQTEKRYEKWIKINKVEKIKERG
jgi:nitrogen fixation NifU-like protein